MTNNNIEKRFANFVVGGVDGDGYGLLLFINVRSVRLSSKALQS